MLHFFFRFVYGLDSRGHIGDRELFSLSWLTIPDRVAYFKLMHIFKIRHNLAPRYLMPNFASISTTHSHFTRGSGHNYHVSKEIARSQNGFAFTAIKIWNSLPDHIKEIDSIVVFKKKLKEFLFTKYEWIPWVWPDLVLVFALFFILTTFLSCYCLDPVGKKSNDSYRLSLIHDFYNVIVLCLIYWI